MNPKDTRKMGVYVALSLGSMLVVLMRNEQLSFVDIFLIGFGGAMMTRAVDLMWP